MRATILGGVAALVAISATPAEAKNTTLCYKAHGVRESVVHKHGKQAPGRNICRYGLRSGKKPSVHQKAKYVRALKRLNYTPQFLTVTAGPPTQPPAATMSAHFAPAGTAACIVQRESGGNPQASNGTHFGIAQWSISTWKAHHGPQMTGAADPRAASYQDQLRVLNSALSTVGKGDWAPYDGC